MGWHCLKTGRKTEVNGKSFALFWQGQTSTCTIDDFRLQCMSLLGWVHDGQKSLGERSDRIYESLKDKYPGVKVFIDKNQFDIDYNCRASVVEVKDGIRYVVWIV